MGRSLKVSQTLFHPKCRGTVLRWKATATKHSKDSPYHFEVYVLTLQKHCRLAVARILMIFNTTTRGESGPRRNYPQYLSDEYLPRYYYCHYAKYELNKPALQSEKPTLGILYFGKNWKTRQSVYVTQIRIYCSGILSNYLGEP